MASQFALKMLEWNWKLVLFDNNDNDKHAIEGKSSKKFSLRAFAKKRLFWFSISLGKSSGLWYWSGMFQRYILKLFEQLASKDVTHYYCSRHFTTLECAISLPFLFSTAAKRKKKFLIKLWWFIITYSFFVMSEK